MSVDKAALLEIARKSTEDFLAAHYPDEAPLFPAYWERAVEALRDVPPEEWRLSPDAVLSQALGGGLGAGGAVGVSEIIRGAIITVVSATAFGASQEEDVDFRSLEQGLIQDVQRLNLPSSLAEQLAGSVQGICRQVREHVMEAARRNAAAARIGTGESLEFPYVLASSAGLAFHKDGSVGGELASGHYLCELGRLLLESCPGNFHWMFGYLAWEDWRSNPTKGPGDFSRRLSDLAQSDRTLGLFDGFWNRKGSLALGKGDKRVLSTSLRYGGDEGGAFAAAPREEEHNLGLYSFAGRPDAGLKFDCNILRATCLCRKAEECLREYGESSDRDDLDEALVHTRRALEWYSRSSGAHLDTVLCAERGAQVTREELGKAELVIRELLVRYKDALFVTGDPVFRGKVERTYGAEVAKGTSILSSIVSGYESTCALPGLESTWSKAVKLLKITVSDVDGATELSKLKTLLAQLRRPGAGSRITRDILDLPRIRSLAAELREVMREACEGMHKHGYSMADIAGYRRVIDATLRDAIVARLKNLEACGPDRKIPYAAVLSQMRKQVEQSILPSKLSRWD